MELVEGDVTAPSCCRSAHPYPGASPLSRPRPPVREAFRRPGRRAPSRSSTDTESRGSTSRTQGAARTTLVAVSQDVPRGAGKQFRLANAPAATDRCPWYPGAGHTTRSGRTPCQPLTLPPADRPASPPDTVTTNGSVGRPDYGDDLHGG